MALKIVSVPRREKKLRTDTFLRLEPLEQKVASMEKRVSESERIIGEDIGGKLKGAQSHMEQMVAQMKKQMDVSFGGEGEGDEAL